jgi:hypothetical protein
VSGEEANKKLPFIKLPLHFLPSLNSLTDVVRERSKSKSVAEAGVVEEDVK